MTTTTITELLQSANALLFDSEGARYPDDDLATMTVWTPRAFSASDNMAEGLDCALSATAEQSEPRTPFAWVDYERTLREGETQVRVWVERHSCVENGLGSRICEVNTCCMA
jgi:hypothetical protein